MLAFSIILILVLLALNAFMAASEIAIVSARKAWLRTLAEDGNNSARRVLDMQENPSRFLATVQVGVTLGGFFASAIGAVSIVKLFAGWLQSVPSSLISSNASGIALVLSTLLLSFLNIVLGELVPKTVAVHRAESLSMSVSRPVEILAGITRPLVYLLTASTNLILRLFGVHERATLPSVTRDELLAMIETAEDEGIVEATDADLIEEAFEFGGIAVRTVMVPRVDVVAVEATTPLRATLDRFFATGFSRLPVYRESLDDVVGVLHVKDVFRVLIGEDGAAATAGEVSRPAYFVPETKPIDELLTELRNRRSQLAIVVDEFGGMAGLVTLEDLIEELVGEITDEFDPGYEPFRVLGPHTIEVDGRIPVGDMLQRLDLEREMLPPEFEGESVGGLISYLLGRIPRKGDSVRVEPLRLDVKVMTGNRVSVVIVHDEREIPPDLGEPTGLTVPPGAA